MIKPRAPQNIIFYSPKVILKILKPVPMLIIGLIVETRKVANIIWLAGDLVDACHDGTWWEGRLLDITPAEDPTNEDGLLYHIQFERYGYELPSKLLKHTPPWWINEASLK